MLTDFDAELTSRLETIQGDGLYRQLREIDSPQSAHVIRDGRQLLNFSSNDYLGLANHPSLKRASCEAIENYGAGAGASRLICGSLSPQHELERKLAKFKGTESALTFSTGYSTAIGTVCALVGRSDIVVIDKLAHASLIDAARLSQATLRIFKHNDLTDLKSKLKWARTEIEKRSRDSEPNTKPRILILTESVFSMDGDLAPLSEIVALKNQFNAWLMVDEAHATGLFGNNLRGCIEEAGLQKQVEIQMGTLGKALGSSGGYICGSQPLIDYLINRARSFIFSTAPNPASAAASSAAIDLLKSDAGRELSRHCWKMTELGKNELSKLGFDLSNVRGPIIPLIIGDEDKAVAISNALAEQGILIPAIRYPTVARGAARLRLTISAGHSENDLEHLFDQLKRILPSPALRHAS